MQTGATWRAETFCHEVPSARVSKDFGGVSRLVQAGQQEYRKQGPKADNKAELMQFIGLIRRSRGT